MTKDDPIVLALLDQFFEPVINGESAESIRAFLKEQPTESIEQFLDYWNWEHSPERRILLETVLWQRAEGTSAGANERLTRQEAKKEESATPEQEEHPVSKSTQDNSDDWDQRHYNLNRKAWISSILIGSATLIVALFFGFDGPAYFQNRSIEPVPLQETPKKEQSTLQRTIPENEVKPIVLSAISIVYEVAIDSIQLEWRLVEPLPREIKSENLPVVGDLRIIELVIGIEEIGSCKIEDWQVESIITVNDLIDVVRAQCTSPANG